MGPNSLTHVYPHIRQLCADLPAHDKGKSGDSWKKKSGQYSTKISEILFLPIKIKQTLFPLEEFTAYLFNNYSSSLNVL